jgi:hypothetical protein
VSVGFIHSLYTDTDRIGRIATSFASLINWLTQTTPSDSSHSTVVRRLLERIAGVCSNFMYSNTHTHTSTHDHSTHTAFTSLHFISFHFISLIDYTPFLFPLICTLSHSYKHINIYYTSSLFQKEFIEGQNFLVTFPALRHL